jgi:hypothetical protein
MKFDFFTYTVASHYASAIINDDWTGLDDEEAVDLQAWLEDVLQKAEHLEMYDEAGFCQDEVTGLMADCVTIRAYFRV